MDGSIEPDVVDGFIESYHRFLKGKLAIDSWGEASGNCRVGYEKCEGSSRLAWKGKGAKTALELIMVSVGIFKVIPALFFCFLEI